MTNKKGGPKIVEPPFRRKILNAAPHFYEVCLALIKYFTMPYGGYLRYTQKP